MNPSKIACLTLAYKNFSYMAGMRHDFVIDAYDKETDPPYKPTQVGVEVVRIKNRGFSENWNEGVRLFRERRPDVTHIILQNSDISYSQADLAYAIFRLKPTVHLATWAFNSAWNWCCKDSKFDRSGGVPFVEFTAPIISLELWDKVGGIDPASPHWGNDIKFCFDAWRLGYKPEVLTDFTFIHANHKSTPNFDGKRFTKECFEYLSKTIGTDWQKQVQSFTPKIKIW